MLLIENDQLQVMNRRKHRGTGSDHDIHFTSLDHLPGIIAFLCRHAAVKDRNPCREMGTDTSHGLRCQRYLGYKIKDTTALLQDLLGNTEIHLGLTASGHPEKQELLLSFRIDHFIDRSLLFIIKRNV